MRAFLEANGVNIYAPISARLSFFNSPYPAHRSGKAVDIYSPLSPIDGKVKKIIKFSDEYLMLIECKDNPKIWAKMLHVKPGVKENEKISVGDKLGDLVESKFFYPWTEKHIHLELRRPQDALRARGGYDLIELKNTHAEFFLSLKLKVKIESVLEHYILLGLPDRYFKRIGNFDGLRYNDGIVCGGHALSVKDIWLTFFYP